VTTLPTASPSSPRPEGVASSSARPEGVTSSSETAVNPAVEDSDDEAFDEFEFLLSRTGIVHVQAPAPGSERVRVRTACGVWSRHFQSLSELPEGVQFCKHKACQSALARAA